jgi:hypothetical protein
VAQASTARPLSCCLVPVQTVTLVNQNDKWCAEAVTGLLEAKPCTGQSGQQWRGPDSAKRIINYASGYCLGASYDRARPPADYFVYLDPCTTNPAYDQQWMTVTPACNWWSVCLPGFMIENTTTQMCLHAEPAVSNSVLVTTKKCDTAATDQRWSVGQTFRH